MRAFGEQLRWRDRLFYAIVLTLAWTISSAILATPSEAAPPKYTRAGYRYADVDNSGECGFFIHSPTYWRKNSVMHTSCTLHAGANAQGILLTYEYPGEGTPRKFGALIEDCTHGQLGDIPFIKIWREGRYGYIHIPGPNPLRPNGIYVHVEHIYWNNFRGIREDTRRCS